MAKALDLSPAYLSALETGHRSAPSRPMIHRVCQYLSIIWDEADELNRLAALSDPRPSLDLRGLPEAHIETGNRLTEQFRKFSDLEVMELATFLDRLEQEEREDWKPVSTNPAPRPRKKKLTPNVTHAPKES